LRVAPQPACHAAVESAEIIVTASHDQADDDNLPVIRAVADAVWRDADHPHRRPLVVGDDAARLPLRREVTVGVLNWYSETMPYPESMNTAAPNSFKCC